MLAEEPTNSQLAVLGSFTSDWRKTGSLVDDDFGGLDDCPDLIARLKVQGFRRRAGDSRDNLDAPQSDDNLGHDAAEFHGFDNPLELVSRAQHVRLTFMNLPSIHVSYKPAFPNQARPHIVPGAGGSPDCWTHKIKNPRL